MNVFGLANLEIYFTNIWYKIIISFTYDQINPLGDSDKGEGFHHWRGGVGAFAQIWTAMMGIR